MNTVYTKGVMKNVFKLFDKIIDKVKGASKSKAAQSTRCNSKGGTPVEIKIGHCARPADFEFVERNRFHSGIQGVERFYSTERPDTEEEICGDTVTWCSLPGNGKALVLSDGMGKGKEAAFSSHKTVIKLRSFLKDGFPPKEALKEVNDFIIRQKAKQILNEDDFATIDLAVVDGKRGRALFYKMGAAVSFVVRGEKVLKIHQSTLPAGIIPEIDIRPATASIAPGDMIVMVSDGVAEADRADFTGGWLTDFLIYEGKKVKQGSEKRPRIVATEILNMAAEKNCGHEADDMTVLVAIVIPVK